MEQQALTKLDRSIAEISLDDAGDTAEVVTSLLRAAEYEYNEAYSGAQPEQPEYLEARAISQSVASMLDERAMTLRSESPEGHEAARATVAELVQTLEPKAAPAQRSFGAGEFSALVSRVEFDLSRV